MLTDQGPARCEHVVVAVGPWVQKIWAMLDLSTTTDILGGDREPHNVPAWTCMCQQEGTRPTGLPSVQARAGSVGQALAGTRHLNR